MIAPQGLGIGEKLLWKYEETRNLVFFQWSELFNQNIVYLATLGAGKLCSSTRMSSLNARSRTALSIKEQDRQNALKSSSIILLSCKL